MHQLFVLFENASGYALFRTEEFEEVAMFLPQVKKSVMDVSKFRSIVHLVAFHPFKNGEEALENMKCVAEGKLHQDLQLFLENNVPKSKKTDRQSVALGIQDPVLASQISETLPITCSTSGPVNEIMRGIRHHFHKLIKGYKDVNIIIKSQQGLGHHYSRAKMNMKSHKFDHMITNSLTILDQLDKDINTLSLRVREWYSLHFPELAKIVPDIQLYVQCLSEIKDIMKLPEDIESKLQLILQNPEQVDKIIEACGISMGMKIAFEDLENMDRFLEQINSLIKRRSEMNDYLKSKMNQIAPNLATVAGAMVGARLISQAGGLTNLSKFSASTVRILGAEKSLFRTMKTKSKETPSFNLLSQNAFIGRTAELAKGRMLRFLANKCTLAARIDSFSKIPGNKYGLEMKQQIEDRAKFYGTKYAAVADPAPLEESKRPPVDKRALLRKRKRERKRKMPPSVEVQDKSLVEEKAKEPDDIPLADSLMEVEKEKEKSPPLSAEDEIVDNEIETDEVKIQKDVQKRTSLKKRRKSLRNIKSRKAVEEDTDDAEETVAVETPKSKKRKSLRY